MASLTDRQLDEAATLYSDHEWSLTDIGDYFECHRSTVARQLIRHGVALRPANLPDPPLRMKQCTNCLQFLPAGMFSTHGHAGKQRLQSWCKPCTNHPKPAAWQTNPQPLAQVVSNWRAA